MDLNNNDFEVFSQNSSTSNKKNNLVKTVFVPFLSGMLGCSLVIGTCFGVPSIKNKLVGERTTTVQTSTSTLSGATATQISLEEYSKTAVATASKILPSTVGIQVSFTATTNSIFGFGSPTTSTATAQGSGIIISKDGYILTNNHVVDASSSNSSYSYYSLSDAKSIKVSLYNDDNTYDAKIVGKDSKTDLAVLKVDLSDLTPAEFADSDSVKVGEFAMAVGRPLGLDTTVTCGIVSAVNREVTDSDGNKYTCIQTDAAINSGNSGGALVNSEGKVIGINTLKLSSTGVEGIGFAIPINSTLDVIDDLIEYNKVIRPYIGITGSNLTEALAKQNNLVVGVYVKKVEDFSAAERAGIQPGDVIIEADGKKIQTMDELNEIKDSHKVGEQMTVKVYRNGIEKELTITLAEMPAD